MVDDHQSERDRTRKTEDAIAHALGDANRPADESDPMVRALRAGMLWGIPAPKRKVRTWNIGATVADSWGKFVFMTLTSWFIESWALMILLGIFAGYLVIPGLAIGYWASFGISALWGMARGSVAQARDYF